MKLPKYVFNSPLMSYTNFTNDYFVNLIDLRRLNKKHKFAVYNPAGKSRMFGNIVEAIDFKSRCEVELLKVSAIRNVGM